jgi:hypothetical protein
VSAAGADIEVVGRQLASVRIETGCKDALVQNPARNIERGLYSSSRRLMIEKVTHYEGEEKLTTCTQ